MNPRIPITTWIALAACAAIIALGAVGIASPASMRAVFEQFTTRGGLVVAGLVRIAIGVALLLAAPASRAPRGLRAFGAFIVLAGLATPFIAIEHVRSIVDWWSAQGGVFMRAWAAFALAIGATLVFFVLPRHSER
jgi:hypothetical protein